MRNTLKNRIQKTMDRITAINTAIDAHQDNIELINSYADGKITLKVDNREARTVNYYCIPQCEKRYRFTLKNLIDQVLRLKEELVILNEYVL